MKSFKQFMGEEGGAVPTSGTPGIQSSIDNPPGPKKRKPYSESVPFGNNTGLSTINGDTVPLTPVLINKNGKRKELGEDTVEAEKERNKATKSPKGTQFATTSKEIKKNDPFSSERKKGIDQMTSHLEENEKYYRDESGKLRLKPEYANQSTPGWKRMDGGLKKKPYVGKDKSEWPKAADVLGKQQKEKAEEKLKEIQRKKEEKELAALIKRKKQQEQLKKMQKDNPPKTVRDINLGLKEELKVGDKGHLGLKVKGGTGFEGTIQDIKDDMILVKSKYDPRRIVRGHKDKFTKG